MVNRNGSVPVVSGETDITPECVVDLIHADMDDICIRMYERIVQNESVLLGDDDSASRFQHLLFQKKSETKEFLKETTGRTISMLLNGTINYCSDKAFCFLVSSYVKGHMETNYSDLGPLYWLYREINGTENKEIPVAEALKIIVPCMVASYGPSDMTEALETSHYQRSAVKPPDSSVGI